MNMVIAERELTVVTEIENCVKLSRLGIKLAGVARNDEELIDFIDFFMPDIVLLDISEFDAVQAVNLARSKYSGCQFIATCGKKRYEYAYSAHKLHSCGFLPKPIDTDDLNFLLNYAVKNALPRAGFFTDLSESGRNIDVHLFFELARKDYVLKPMTVERVNSLMEKNFQKGRFRVYHMKFDFLENAMPSAEAAARIQSRCMKIVGDMLGQYCFDMMFTNEPLFSRALINYAEETEEELRGALENCILRIKTLLPEPDFSNITIGVSFPFTSFSNLYSAMTEAGEALWLRFSQGAGQVIYREKGEELPVYYKNQFDVYEQNLKKACALLDIDDFTKNINEFFSLPGSVLICKETKTLISRVEKYMYDVNRELIALFSDADQINKKIRDSQRLASTLEEYKNSYVINMTELFKEISLHAPQNSKSVLQAQIYVSENIDKDLSLHTVSEHVGLSPVYFSALFKKKTGENFTDYVNYKKIQAAKKLLSEKNVKISKISVLTGFSNSKYFSKLFRKLEGLTPSEYRKKHT